MPSAAYMRMMMMMIVFSSGHAKQQLSLVLLPKVFFHLSSITFLYPVSRLSFSLLNIVPHLPEPFFPFQDTLRFVPLVLYLPSLFDIGIVMVPWLWIHRLVFILFVLTVFVLWLCNLPLFFCTAFGSEPDLVENIKFKKEKVVLASRWTKSFIWSYINVLTM